MLRYKLRTLLILLTILPPILAGAWFLLGRGPVGSTTINGSQVIIFRAARFGGVGISDNDKSVTANFGEQTVFVDAKQVDIVGVRSVHLPAKWSKLELTRTARDVQIVLDGAPLK
jgi:hypothetical protein